MFDRLYDCGREDGSHIEEDTSLDESHMSKSVETIRMERSRCLPMWDYDHWISHVLCIMDNREPVLSAGREENTHWLTIFLHVTFLYKHKWGFKLSLKPFVVTIDAKYGRNSFILHKSLTGRCSAKSCSVE